jgi:hypothetical protein
MSSIEITLAFGEPLVQVVERKEATNYDGEEHQVG